MHLFYERVIFMFYYFIDLSRKPPGKNLLYRVLWRYHRVSQRLPPSNSQFAENHSRGWQNTKNVPQVSTKLYKNRFINVGLISLLGFTTLLLHAILLVFYSESALCQMNEVKGNAHRMGIHLRNWIHRFAKIVSSR